jgi:hypothetical protein
MGTFSDMGRNEPLALFGGAVAAGFAISRFLKSSSDNSRGNPKMRAPQRPWQRVAYVLRGRDPPACQNPKKPLTIRGRSLARFLFPGIMQAVGIFVIEAILKHYPLH